MQAAKYRSQVARELTATFLLFSPQVKVLLSPIYNPLVERRQIRSGMAIVLNKWERHPVKKQYLSSVLCFPIATHVYVVSADVLTALEIAEHHQLPWAVISLIRQRTDLENGELGISEDFLESALKDQENRPFVSSRGCYLHQLADNIPLGPQWDPTLSKNLTKSAKYAQDVHEDHSDTLVLLSHLVDDFEAHCKSRAEHYNQQSTDPLDHNANAQAKPRPRASMLVRGKFLLLRVLAKTVLFNDGHPDHPDKYPFHFSVRVTDASKMEVDLIFWSVLTPIFYEALFSGQILRLNEIRLRERYPATPAPQYSVMTEAFISPPFEVVYNPRQLASGPVGQCAILEGAFADALSDIYPRSTIKSQNVPQLAYGMSPEDQDDQPSTLSLSELKPSIDLAARLRNVYGVVRWIGPTERVALRYEESNGSPSRYIIYKWVRLKGIDVDLLVQLVKTEGSEAWDCLAVNDKVLIEHLRVQYHLGQLIGFSTIYTVFSVYDTWEDYSKTVAGMKASTFLATPPAETFFDSDRWPLTLRCPSVGVYKETYKPQYLVGLDELDKTQIDKLPLFCRIHLLFVCTIGFHKPLYDDSVTEECFGVGSIQESQQIWAKVKNNPSKNRQQTHLFELRDCQQPTTCMNVVLPLTSHHLGFPSQQVPKPNLWSYDELQDVLCENWQVRKSLLPVISKLLVGVTAYRESSTSVVYILNNIWPNPTIGSQEELLLREMVSFGWSM